MCGITGCVAFGGDLDASRTVMEAMTETLQFRGPDDEGVWVDESVAMGHQRLAVIDPRGGRQPMTVDTVAGPVTIVHSGEIYNFAELRAELRRSGRHFTTLSDTEVVLQGYLEWGESLATRLNGIFAFAIWDGRRQVLVMVRDRLGVKPLYYYPTAHGALFASEPKAILAHPKATRVIDLSGLRKTLAYAITVPGVPWAGMYEVMPGDVVTVDQSGVTVRPYWRLPTCEHVDDRPKTVDRVRELLEDIVRWQLIADVPVGMLLSGGLDSSTLTVLAARHRARQSDRVDTFDVDFTDYAEHFVADYERAAPDGTYVAEVVAHVRARHRTIALDPGAIMDPDLRRTVVRAYDVPPGFGDRDRSMYLLFQAVRETATVALSGEAADELFGGYAWFHDPAVQRAQAFPWIAACFAAYGLAPGALDPDLESALDLPGYLGDQYAAAAANIDHLDRATEHERCMRTASYLHLTQALRVLLDRKDRLSMATGLEVRVPYCDHRLVEYVYNAPWSMKCFDGREKSLLRAAAGDLLPASVLNRVKSAYPSIRDPHYVAVLRDQVAELISDRANPVFAIVRRSWLTDAARTEMLTRSARDRNSVEWILNLAAWLDVSRPELRLS
jgi:asparagine synthase (glutamine-hydrolysing)